MKLLFLKLNYNDLSPSSYTHNLYERFIYFQDRSIFPAAGKYADRSWESLTETWMWQLVLRPRNSHKRNTSMGFSLQRMTIYGPIEEIQRPNYWTESGQNYEEFFPPCYLQSPIQYTALPWDFHFYKRTQPLTVSTVCSCKGERRKTS